MKTINIVIQGDKVTMIKALTALQNAKIEVVGVQVGAGKTKVKKANDKPYKLAEEYHGAYKDKIKAI